MSLGDRVRLCVQNNLNAVDKAGFLASPTSAQQIQRTPGFGFVTTSLVQKTFKGRELDQRNGRVILHGHQVVKLGARKALEDQWGPKVEKLVERVVKEEQRMLEEKKRRGKK